MKEIKQEVKKDFSHASPTPNPHPTKKKFFHASPNPNPNPHPHTSNAYRIQLKVRKPLFQIISIPFFFQTVTTTWKKSRIFRWHSVQQKHASLKRKNLLSSEKSFNCK